MRQIVAAAAALVVMLPSRFAEAHFLSQGDAAVVDTDGYAALFNLVYLIVLLGLCAMGVTVCFSPPYDFVPPPSCPQACAAERVIKVQIVSGDLPKGGR
jgi:hypothetical protein